jgi:hypothetical protein
MSTIQWLMLEIVPAAEGSTNRGKWGDARALAIRRTVLPHTAGGVWAEWGMGNGEWRVGSGPWAVGRGEWA